LRQNRITNAGNAFVGCLMKNETVRTKKVFPWRYRFPSSIAPIVEGTAATLYRTRRFCRHAERYGYHRYWLRSITMPVLRGRDRHPDCLMSPRHALDPCGFGWNHVPTMRRSSWTGSWTLEHSIRAHRPRMGRSGTTAHLPCVRRD